LMIFDICNPMYLQPLTNGREQTKRPGVNEFPS
jgi:hypothetical protein